MIVCRSTLVVVSMTVVGAAVAAPDPSTLTTEYEGLPGGRGNASAVAAKSAVAIKADCCDKCISENRMCNDRKSATCNVAVVASLSLRVFRLVGFDNL